MPKTVCVYCASSTQIDKSYFNAAKDLGLLLAQNNIRLIYGGGNIGLMGLLADSVLSGGGKVTGIIPQFMIDMNWHHKHLTELITVGSMHERKALMASMSEAVIALPGGCGTMEELLEMITWKQLGLFLCPIVVLNTNDYYNELIKMLDKAVDQHFMREIHSQMWSVVHDVESIIPTINATEKWDKTTRKFAAI
ncbi:MAG: TIGR00730 family Rossman fold protein [Prevotellaceae bacterium]|jgi:uncharacterized protein (TIGR00730 family)|nr:TIGR00730 family Rossman fold protein [Prevotellaceae bacterium]